MHRAACPAVIIEKRCKSAIYAGVCRLFGSTPATNPELLALKRHNDTDKITQSPSRLLL
jgi:hypothetical protein